MLSKYIHLGSLKNRKQAIGAIISGITLFKKEINSKNASLGWWVKPSGCVSELERGHKKHTRVIEWLYSKLTRMLLVSACLCFCVNEWRLLAVYMCKGVKAPGCVPVSSSEAHGCVYVLMSEGSWLCLYANDWRLLAVSLCSVCCINNWWIVNFCEFLPLCNLESELVSLIPVPPYFTYPNTVLSVGMYRIQQAKRTFIIKFSKYST
jgi:hypothetical protein